MNMLMGFMASQAIRTAAELRLPDLVQDGPRSTAALARGTGTNENNLSRLLRALVSLGVLSEPDRGTYGPTALSACLQSDDPRSLYGLARILRPAQWNAAGELLYSVQSGKPAFEHLYGKDFWRYFQEDDVEGGAVFNLAMTSLSSSADEAIAEAYDFSSIRTLVDVGGGYGSLLKAVLRRHPSVKALLFDLKPVIEDARELVARDGFEDRIELVAGDFFYGVPTGGDAYIMRQVIHDWSDSQCKIILDNCVQAMNPGGTLLVVERILGPRIADPLDTLNDLVMMVDNPGGRERDEAEFRNLFASANLTLRRIVPTGSPWNVIEVARPERH